MSEVVVTDNRDASRFEAQVDGEPAGFAAYQLTDALVVFTHTEVDGRCEGQGVGSALARQSLDLVRADGRRKVLAICPFIKGWIERHWDYADLLYDRPAGTARD
ncbi:GNAT family N-acetyltransferase [Phycicoccus flavus]|uniref:GNAT family N-acetyltransferase n=1 Tax=Phycicoccus flavus TaxID=2502783 RepID=UPI000FEC16DD|nr:GNAT family N-acetyltransferase [Phycicoccus flavus]NHA66837.1 N-acetyltransferase [Phycicoccus flavus]